MHKALPYSASMMRCIFVRTRVPASRAPLGQQVTNPNPRLSPLPVALLPRQPRNLTRPPNATRDLPSIGPLRHSPDDQAAYPSTNAHQDPLSETPVLSYPHVNSHATHPTAYQPPAPSTYLAQSQPEQTCRCPRPAVCPGFRYPPPAPSSRMASRQGLRSCERR